MLTKGRNIVDCQEASWCYKCARRNSCQEKDMVACEERMAAGALRHLKVTAECSQFIFDSRVKINPQESFLEKLMRGGI